ncbi:MAG: dTDP-4-amino-4,6-dideoxygalactose transaminase [bacterium]
MSNQIPFNRPPRVGTEFTYAEEAFQFGQISGDGPFTKRCSDLLQKELGVPRALLTTSCTHALEMTALLLNIGPGDEFIVPSFTFTSTATSYAIRGAKPVFVDVRPDTLNIDETLLEAAITPRTKVILVVHYAGVACEMDEILRIAKKHNLPVVEDAAHALFGKYRGKTLGTMAEMGALSFHETKNFSCGEGGAILVNDPQYITRAEIIREKGTNRSQFFRGQVDKYTWCDHGSSYLPSDLLAAILLGQLEARERIQARRKTIWERYHTELEAWAAANEIVQPTIPEGCEHTFHLYYLLLPNLAARSEFIDKLKAKGVMTVFHYQPLHLAPMGRKFGGFDGQCPVTEDVADRLVRLPVFFNMTDDENDRVVSAILETTFD